MIMVKQVTDGLPRWLSGKESTWNAGDTGLIPGSGRSPGEGNAIHNLLQYSCLEKNGCTREPGRLQSIGSQSGRHNLVTKPPLRI